jgi:tetratricopeptide (TPR) repeat protein
MKKILAILLLLGGAQALLSQAPAGTADARLSPAERTMAQTQTLIEKNPKDFEAYNALALALSRRAREISDVKFYGQAEEALQKSFAISPDNFDGRRIHVWLLLGKHEFAAALEEAKKLNQRMPDDIMVYGFLADANAELGNYADAEHAAQWMLDLKPGNIPGLTRAAYLRELFGDIDGAVELMNMAYQSTPPNEYEDAAWILAQLAHLKLMAGTIDQAEKLCEQALSIFSDYHYALGNLAKVRIQQKRYDDAVELLKGRYQIAPHAENLYDLAEALQMAGRTGEAGKDFAEFEQKSIAESVRADNSNRELIFYYADHANQPEKALEVAQKEFARRHDVYTLDAYAWALHVSGQDQEARKQIDAALAVGIRDAKLIRHAGEIALKQGDKAGAEKYLKQVTELNPTNLKNARSVVAGLSSPAATR